MNDETYSDRLRDFAETALLPLYSFKEMLLDLDIPGYETPTVDPVRIGTILESLLKQVESQFVAAEAALDKHVGDIQFTRARVGYPGASSGDIVGVEMKPGKATIEATMEKMPEAQA